ASSSPGARPFSAPSGSVSSGQFRRRRLRRANPPAQLRLRKFRRGLAVRRSLLLLGDFGLPGEPKRAQPGRLGGFRFARGAVRPYKFRKFFLCHIELLLDRTPVTPTPYMGIIRADARDPQERRRSASRHRFPRGGPTQNQRPAPAGYHFFGAPVVMLDRVATAAGFFLAVFGFFGSRLLRF